MTEEEIKNKISEHKECCKKLAEEYRQRYNEDNTDKLALNMFYHNVIAYNDFETILAIIEDRNSMIMCFSEPPLLTEKTVEVELNRIADLEKENTELKERNAELKGMYAHSAREAGTYKQFLELKEKENAELKERADKADLDSVLFFNQLCKAKEIIKEFVHHYKAKTIYIENMKNLLEQAEQFISEVEK
jgi:hypothetical protein